MLLRSTGQSRGLREEARGSDLTLSAVSLWVFAAVPRTGKVCLRYGMHVIPSPYLWPTMWNFSLAGALRRAKSCLAISLLQSPLHGFPKEVPRDYANRVYGYGRRNCKLPSWSPTGALFPLERLETTIRHQNSAVQIPDRGRRVNSSHVPIPRSACSAFLISYSEFPPH